MTNLSRLLAVSTSLLAVAAPCAAFAQRSWGGIYPSIFLTSDYRYDGLSLTGHEPTVQGSLYWAHPSDSYAGVWVSGVDFSDLGDVTTSYEVEVYGGHGFDVGSTRLTFEAMYSMFPDNDIPGPTYDFLTAKLRATRSFESLTLGGDLSYVPELPYGGGRQWRLASEASYRWNDWLSGSVAIGRRWAEAQRERSFWDVGATAKWNSVSFDLRYSDTNHDVADCGYIDWCESGVTLTLQVDLWK
jgi:uncharacterized protein (TIGR02001 family)